MISRRRTTPSPFPLIDTVSRMTEPHRNFPSKPLRDLMIAALLVSISGCMQLPGRSQLAGFGNPAAEATGDNQFLAPAASQINQPETSAVQIANNSAARGAPVQQASHTQRHVARQQPAVQQAAPQVAQANAVQPVNHGAATAANQGVAQVQGIRPLDIPPPGVQGPLNYDPSVTPGEGTPFPPLGTAPVYTPNVREADLIINGYPGRTGRITFGAAVNSDAGVTGQITVDERNFDIMRWPRSFQDLFRGNAFRGKGQTLRIEATPGSQFQRYIVQFANPNLFAYMPISLSLSGFLYDRRFDDWSEERLGGRASLGYRLTPDLSLSVGFSGQNVGVYDPRNLITPELNDVLGDNALYSGSVSLRHDTRNSPIQASDGHYFEFKFEEAFGSYNYARFDLEYRKYWLLAQRADFSGKQTLSYSTQLGFSGDDTPIFENYFAGGYATLRGFDFRAASPISDTSVELGGRFQWLNAVEYMFPITADDAFRGVAFVDFGTVERNVTLNDDTFRVAPGLGLRVAIPMLGPAPLAFDFAYPVAKADFDRRRIFSFYMSVIR